MAYQPEVVSYDAGIYQIETTDPVDGGVGSITNAPLLSLANRTAYLKQHLDNLESGATLISAYVTKNSPNFTGSPTVPNQSAGDDSTKIANTAFVQDATNGVASVNIAGATTTTLTSAQYGLPILVLSGAVTGNKAVVFPSQPGMWLIANSSTGDFTVTLKTASGNGTIIPRTNAAWVFSDGVDVYSGTTYLPSLTVSGASALYSTLSVTGAVSLSSTLSVAGASTLTGGASLKSTLDVTGIATFGATLSVAGALTVTGAATLKSTLGVTGNTTVGGTLGVTGAATFSNTLSATGNATLSASLTVGGNTTLSGTLGVNGESVSNYANAWRIATGNYGSFWRNDGTNLYLMITASGSPLGTWGDLRPFTVNLTTGGVSFNHPVSMTTLSLAGAAVLSTTLQVTGATTLQSTLGVTGVATLGSNLGVAGTSTLTGAAVLKSTLQVAGTTTLSGAVNIGGNLVGQGGTFQSSGATATVVIRDTGASGANLMLAGSGTAGPNKYIRAANGSLDIVNNAYSAVVASVSDTGAFTATSIGTAGRVSAGDVLSSGNVYAGGGQSYLQTDGNIAGPLWGGGYLSAYLSNNYTTRTNISNDLVSYASGAGQVGTYALLMTGGGSTSNADPLMPGALIAGGNCIFTNVYGNPSGGNAAGTWRLMGYVFNHDGSNQDSITLCMRVA